MKKPKTKPMAKAPMAPESSATPPDVAVRPPAVAASSLSGSSAAVPTAPTSTTPPPGVGSNPAAPAVKGNSQGEKFNTDNLLASSAFHRGRGFNAR